MALSAVSATFITMPKAKLQLPIYKPQQHPKNIIIKCGKPRRPPVKGGRGGQTNGGEKKMNTSDSGRISNAPAVKETEDKTKPKHHEGSSEKSMA